jgi:hypothetical protein
MFSSNSKEYPNGPSTLKTSSLEQLHQCSQYVTLQIENWMNKSQNMLVWLSTMVLALQFALFADACKRHSKAQHLP